MARHMQNACAETHVQKLYRPTPNQNNEVKANNVQHTQMPDNSLRFVLVESV